MDASRKRKLRRILVCLALGLVLYVALDAWRFFADCRDYALSPAKEPPWPPTPREAIVVLTGYRGRIPKAISLLRSRGSGLLLITGAGRDVSKRDLLNQQGDAAVNVQEVWERIEVESQAASTIENAIESAKILSTRGIEKVILVTSDFHMPRSLATFRRVFPNVTYWPYPVAGENSAGDGTAAYQRFVENYSRPAIEFVKHFAFRHLFSHLL